MRENESVRQTRTTVSSPQSTAAKALRISAIVTFLLVLYVNVSLLRPQAPLLPLPMSQSVIVTVATTLFALVHAAALLGKRATAMFFALAAVVSWSFEHIGVTTGRIYGAYHYGDSLGAKLGQVPILIPLAWFMMIYPAYVIANLIVDGRTHGGIVSTSRVLWRAAIAAMVMTAWDIVIDPGMAADGAWTWEQGGVYFGVPLLNFAGWLITTGTVYVIWGLIDRRRERAPRDPSLWFSILPVLVYAMMTARYVVGNERGVLGVVAFFAMGFPVLIALRQAFERPSVSAA